MSPQYTPHVLLNNASNPRNQVESEWVLGHVGTFRGATLDVRSTMWRGQLFTSFYAVGKFPSHMSTPRCASVSQCVAAAKRYVDRITDGQP